MSEELDEKNCLLYLLIADVIKSTSNFDVSNSKAIGITIGREFVPSVNTNRYEHLLYCQPSMLMVQIEGNPMLEKAFTLCGHIDTLRGKHNTGDINSAEVINSLCSFRIYVFIAYMDSSISKLIGET
ncbi:hypothetical protein V6N12_009657 [Hibiscus sabdariffa]|uniref:Uncharacterized protein n=1 Tax=Hibiscus sabdariffa TaxID=183260 RepID=A0ABR2BUJ3_9ROSI